MRRLSAFLVMFSPLLALIAGCSTIQKQYACTKSTCKSSVISRPASNGAVHSGVLYSIPKQLVQFSIERKTVTKKTLQDAADKAKKAVDEGKAAIGAQEKLIKQFTFKVGKLAEGSPAASKLALDLELAKVHLVLLKQNQTDLVKARQKADASLANFDGEKHRDAIEIKPLEPVPDRTLTFAAQLNQSALTSETYEIKTTKSGLLSGGSGKSEGQADEIFVSFAKALSVLQFPGAAKSMQYQAFTDQPLLGRGAAAACDAPAGTKVKATFEPLDSDSLKALNQLLITSKLCYRLELPAAPGPAATVNTASLLDGLAYPSRQSLQVNLYHSPNGTVDATGQLSRPASGPERIFYVDVIDSSRLGVIPLKKGMFADNEYEFEFANGVLTRYKSVTPNQLISALGMIPEAGRALLSIPAELIQLKIDYSSKEAAYIEAQQALYEARKLYEGLLEAEAAETVDEVE